MTSLQKLILYILCLSAFSALGQTQNDILQDSLWSFSIKKYPSEAPLIDSSSVYVGADVSPICCLDKKTGKLKWKSDIAVSSKNGFMHTIRDDNKGRIFFNGESRNLYAAEKATGKILWKFELKFDDDVCSNITVLHDTIFVNPVSPIFVALHTDGKVAWVTDLTSYCTGYAIDKNIIVCQLIGGGFCVLDRSTGKILKTVSVGGQQIFFAHPPAFFDNLFIIGNERDSVTSYDRSTFEVKWNIDNRRVQCTDKGNLYAHNDTLFVKLDPRSSNQIWRIYGDFGWFLQPTFYNNKVYLQTRYHFYIIDNETGEILYECPFKHKSYTKPIVENGIIYLGYTETYTAVKDPTYKKKK